MCDALQILLGGRSSLVYPLKSAATDIVQSRAMCCVARHAPVTDVAVVRKLRLWPVASLAVPHRLRRPAEGLQAVFRA